MSATRIKVIATLVVVLTLSCNVVVTSQTMSPVWAPPTPRKAKTPFAPKPLATYNIFKGDADRWLADAIEMVDDPLQDKVLNNFVAMIGDYVARYSVAPTKHYQFIITCDRSPDAMTAGGGRIYISLGMLGLIENEDELAGVLAHEIGHDAFQHAARMVSRQMFWLTGAKKIQSPEDAEKALSELNASITRPAAFGESLLGFARFDELEADRAAFYNLYKAGYNPHALITALKRLQRESDDMEEQGTKKKFLLLLFGTHPPTGQRTFALTWESNWVNMPSENFFHASAAFDAMKRRVEEITKQN